MFKNSKCSSPTNYGGHGTCEKLCLTFVNMPPNYNVVWNMCSKEKVHNS